MFSSCPHDLIHLGQIVKCSFPFLRDVIDAATHWKLDTPVQWLFEKGTEKGADHIAVVLAWREKSEGAVDLLRMILSFKTKSNSSEPIMTRAAPLRKDLEASFSVHLVRHLSHTVITYPHHTLLHDNSFLQMPVFSAHLISSRPR